MKKILFTSSAGDLIGGGQRSLLLLLERLDRSLYEPVLCCPKPGEFTDKASQLNIQTIILKTPSLKFLPILSFFRILSFCKRSSFDLIHTDAPRQAIFFCLIARILSIPVVLHVRVGYCDSSLLDRLLYMLAHKVIAVSNAAALRFSTFSLSSPTHGTGAPSKRRDERVPSEEGTPVPRVGLSEPTMSNKKNKKLVVIHNGVSIDSFNQTISTSTIKNELKLNNTIIVGTVGQLLPLKGQDIFIEAAAQIIPQCSVPVKFLICGRGTPEYETILKKKVTNNNLSDSVIFTGFRSDIPQLMACLDIFALASTYREGLSRVIIEAMASAKPVVAFDTGGNREAVETGFTGMLVPPGDTGLFAAALLQLIHNTNLREEWGSAGRLRIEQHFSINENVRRIQELYKEIL